MSEEENQRHLEKIPHWPNFEVIIEGESGRIPVTKIENWRKFSEILEHEYFNRRNTELVYRGNRRYDWSLTPSLGRLDHRGIITEDMAIGQIEYFRKAVRGRLLDRTLVDKEEENELWAVGQHHGLMTPLLDWTYSPYVALFFAFNQPDKKTELDNPYRAIHVLNKTYIEESPNPIEVLEPRKDDHGRLVNQAGLFTKSEYGNTLENQLINSLEEEDLINVSEDEEASKISDYICKIYIPNEERDECIMHLRRMNVHHASLFPDVLGAAQHTNTVTSERKKTEDIVDAEKEIEVRKAEPHKSEEIDHRLDPSESLIENIEDLLRSIPESKQVESGRILIIAKEIAQEIEKYKLVDWDKRESLQAQLRVQTRVVLRKYGYPKKLIEGMTEKIINFLNGKVD